MWLLPKKSGVGFNKLKLEGRGESKSFLNVSTKVNLPAKEYSHCVYSGVQSQCLRGRPDRVTLVLINPEAGGSLEERPCLSVSLT